MGIVYCNEIISQFCFLINQADQLLSLKEGRANLNCFALATNQGCVHRWWLWVNWHVATRYSAVTLLLVCLSPASLTGRVFSQPFHHFYSSNTSINYDPGSPSLLHSRVSVDFLVPVSYWLIYLSTLASRYLWVTFNFSIYPHYLNLWISVTVQWINNETAVNKACLCGVWYCCFVSSVFLLACLLTIAPSPLDSVCLSNVTAIFDPVMQLEVFY